MRIGVFDSGIGGLTVLRKLIEKFPNNEYIYYGDSKNVPYGNKSIDELKELSSNIIEYLINKKVDLIIIACGTVSSNLSDYLKNKYSIKIVDIISPTIEYLNNSNYTKIGVLATSNTINSKVFSKNINKDVKEIECPLFVPMIESNNYKELDNCLDLYLKDLKDREIVVLGCTHYPLIKKEIENYLHNSIVLDMGDNINCISNEGNNKIDLYFTKIDDNLLENVSKIMKEYNYSINNID